MKRLKKSIQDAIGRRSLALLLFFQATFQRGSAPFLKGEEATRRALEWTSEDREKPFFAWIHSMDVHYPYLPLEKPTVGRRLRYLGAMLQLLAGARRGPLRLMRRLYRRRVERMDRTIGRLVDGLTELGLRERTVIAITADHGEAFSEHGSYTHGPQLYDELLRVPLIISGIGGSGTVDRQAGLIDLAPTLLEHLGVQAPLAFQGRSLDAPGRSEKEPVFSAATHAGGRERRGASEEVYRIVSCRRERWKFIRDEEDRKEELYDLAADPQETRNLIYRRSEQAGPLRRLVEEHLEMVENEAERLGEGGPGRAFHEDAEVARRLADLGYL